VALAGRFPRRWWLAAAVVFAAFGFLFALGSGPLLSLGTHRLRSAELRHDARVLERRIGVVGTPVRVEKVSDTTKEINAESVGVGPTKRVIIWDTLLDGRFPNREIRFAIAHELGHVLRNHVWKGVAWFALLFLPGAFVLAAVTRRRGGLGDPGVLPFGMLVLTVLQLVLLPAENVVSRRYEAEADWVALRTTQDPRSARAIFRRFSSVDLAQPSPPTWDYVLLENHPTVMQRIAMVEAFRNRRAEASPAGS
jgi:STE24 endopeptidase